MKRLLVMAIALLGLALPVAATVAQPGPARQRTAPQGAAHAPAPDFPDTCQGCKR